MPLTKVASSMLASGAAGSGGSTGKNYISSYNNGNCNGDFESGSDSGWLLCQVSSITNGLPSGLTLNAGTVTKSLAPSAIAGQYSLQTVFPATANQGFVSEIFTIDTEDQAKVLTFKFYYQVTAGASSGNFSGTSSNTFIVGIYAVNGSNIGWFQPAGLYSMTQSSGAGIATGTFQTYSDATQYRFAVLCASAPSGSITVTFDDFSVGPQTAPIGPVATDWINYTPTTVSGMTSTVQYSQYRRSGDSVEIQARFSVTAVAGSTLSISLPSGLVTDPNKITVTGITGFASAQVGVGGVLRFNVLGTPSGTSINFGPNLSASNGNAILAATDNLSFFASIPVSGWSSNVQMSNDTDTRVVAARIGGAPAPTSANGILIYPTILQDTHGAYNATTGQYRVPVSGFYQVSAYINCSNPNGQLYASLDGTIQVPSMGYVFNSVGSGGGFTTVYANAGQLLDVRFSQGCTGFSATINGLTITRLSGPSVVAASETVAARMTSSVVVSGSGSTIVNFNNIIYDTHGMCTTGASAKITVPVSGKYRISALLSFQSQANNDIRFMELWKQGLYFCRLAGLPNVGLLAAQLSGSTTLQLNAGEYIDIRFNNSGGFSKSTTGDGNENWVCLERVGN